MSAKNSLKTIIAIVSFGVVADIHASDWQYVDTPLRLTAKYPDEVPCRIYYESNSKRMTCSVPDLSGAENLKIRDIKTGRVTVRKDPNHMSIICSTDGMCQDMNTDQFLGHIKQGTVTAANGAFFHLTKGYYLHQMEGDHVKAHRFMTGPMANDFNFHDVIENDHDAYWNIPVSQRAIYQEPKLPEDHYSVLKNGNDYSVIFPDGDRVDGLALNELHHYIPFTQADGGFCPSGAIMCLNRDGFVYGLGFVRKALSANFTYAKAA
ncbi:hypothetical protein LG290_04535 [Halomonas sediminis]